MATDPCYNRFFEYITDPVQRNSLRQQWSQMLNAGLSNADLRILLDKYPDFRFAVQELIRNRIADDQYLDYPEKIKEFATIFPEFKQLVDQQIKALPELRRMREFMRKIKEENKQDEEQVRKMYEARFAEEQAKMWDYRNGPPSSYF
jgi:thymidylate kinase